MSRTPIITFKAGMCHVDHRSKPFKVEVVPTPGYIYLYSEDDLTHFCWRPRDHPIEESYTDLVMIPGDARFLPYDTRSPTQPTSKTNGRIFSLKFESSCERHIFWLQSKPQGRSGDPAWMSPRDLKIGDIVDRILQGDEVDVDRELASVRNSSNDDSRRDGDDDATMEDAGGQGHIGEHPEGGSGGAGADATGGDIRQEGEEAREGGADGARAAAGQSANTDAATAVRNFLESLKGAPGLAGQSSAQGKLYPLLSDLLEPSVTVPMIEAASDDYLDNLLSFLPPAVLVLAAEADSDESDASEPNAEALTAIQAAISTREKKALLQKVLRSPQFTQSLASLTMAIRDGGLPSIAEALGVSVANGGLVKGGSIPLGGGDAVEAFVEGVKKTVQKK